MSVQSEQYQHSESVIKANGKQRLAVIGSGIAGLSTAYLLKRYGGFDVTLIEAAARLGGHTATIDVREKILLSIDMPLVIDTGFIVYNDWTYPNFIQLLHEIGVANQPTDMSFSVSCADSALEYSGSSLNTLFAQRRNLVSPQFYSLLLQIVRFNRQAIADLASGRVEEGATLGEYLQANHYHGLFTSHYLVPMCAAIWSASLQNVLAFPLLFFVRFFKNHGLLNITNRPQWRVVQGGSRAYIEPLTRSFANKIRLNSPVQAIARFHDHVQLQFGDGTTEAFDQVVIATHSDQALAMLRDASTAESEVLQAVPYQMNDVVLHTDLTLLPKQRRAWAAWNYLLDKSRQDQAVLTYNMNILQSLPTDTTYCVTLNNTDKIDPAKIIGRYQYAHPVFSLQAVAAQERWAEINGVNRTWFCGAYWGNGFHEDGVVSAVRIAQALGVNWGVLPDA